MIQFLSKEIFYFQKLINEFSLWNDHTECYHSNDSGNFNLISGEIFRLAIVIAMLCTVLAVLLIALGVSWDVSSCIPEAYYPAGSVSGAIVSLGTFLFAFSGHQVFPTIQHDMYRPIDFTKSIILGFCCKFLNFLFKIKNLISMKSYLMHEYFSNFFRNNFKEKINANKNLKQNHKIWYFYKNAEWQN